MLLFLVSVLLFFGVNGHLDGDYPTCSVDTPYPVYEFSKELGLLFESVPQIKCDDRPAQQVVRFNCKAK